MASDTRQSAETLTLELRGMHPEKSVRVLVTVAKPAPPVPAAEPKAAHLAGLPTSRMPGLPTSRASRRSALIETQARANSAVTASVRSKLESLGLEVRGGTLMPVFVVEGKPQAIQRVLEIDGIASVELDRAVSLEPSPTRR